LAITERVRVTGDILDSIAVEIGKNAYLRGFPLQLHDVENVVVENPVPVDAAKAQVVEELP
jgi:hypothetical protein